VARKLGIEVVDRTKFTNVVEKLMELEPRGFDVVVEAAGFRFASSLLNKVERAIGLETDTSEILLECFNAVRKFRKVSIIADYVGFTNHFPIGHIMFKQLTVRSGQCPCQKYFDTVMDHLKSGEFDPSFLVTHRIKLSDGPMAYDKLFYQKDGYIKMFITPEPVV